MQVLFNKAKKFTLDNHFRLPYSKNREGREEIKVKEKFPMNTFKLNFLFCSFPIINPFE